MVRRELPSDWLDHLGFIQQLDSILFIGNMPIILAGPFFLSIKCFSAACFMLLFFQGIIIITFQLENLGFYLFLLSFFCFLQGVQKTSWHILCFYIFFFFDNRTLYSQWLNANTHHTLGLVLSPFSSSFFHWRLV
jgi:hypothetical protein